MKLKGKLHISLPSCSTGKRAIHIEILDDLSGCQFVEVEVSLEDYVEASIGHRYVECDIDFAEKAPIGKLREYKTELVPRPPIASDKDQKRIGPKYLKPFEVDGWQGCLRDLFNPHKWQGDKVAVGFERWVEAKGPTP